MDEEVFSYDNYDEEEDYVGGQVEAGRETGIKEDAEAPPELPKKRWPRMQRYRVNLTALSQIYNVSTTDTQNVHLASKKPLTSQTNNITVILRGICATYICLPASEGFLA